ncbi:MAG: hypothetical protein H7838_12780 [Magnetococcus sp. DMHC-8]
MNIEKELGLPNFLQGEVLPLELNFYGAARLVADQLGIKNPPVSRVSWTHGWRQDLVRADQLACDAHLGVIGQPDTTVIIPAHRRRPYLVATKAIEALLRDSGFPDTRAVGLPFTYAPPDPTVTRIPDSLLVMPTHVLLRMEARANEIEYLEYIQSIAHQFSRVVFCINLSCAGTGLWINNLEKYGFDYVFGAGLMDQMALHRMRRLFDTFEYMTSNGIGSHFVYAGLCRVKVSLAGPLDRYPWDLHKNEPAWQDPVEREKQILSASMFQHDFIKQRYPWLYREPRDGVECVEWAREESGYYNKVSFVELAHLFGWVRPPANQPEGVLEAVFRLDAAESISEFIQYVQDARHNPVELIFATTQLLARTRLRAAYILAMLLTNRGHRSVAISLALGIGGAVYGNPLEVDRGLAHLQSLVDTLSVEQQTLVDQRLVKPAMVPLLAFAIQQGDDPHLQQLLTIVQAAVPRLRPLLARPSTEELAQDVAPAPWTREQAILVLQAWSSETRPA